MPPVGLPPRWKPSVSARIIVSAGPVQIRQVLRGKSRSMSSSVTAVVLVACGPGHIRAERVRAWHKDERTVLLADVFEVDERLDDPQVFGVVMPELGRACRFIGRVVEPCADGMERGPHA